MGEGINVGRGGKAKKLPILNANYPADVSVEYNGNATFKIEIAEHGYPEEYTYQWYLDNGVLSGGNDTSYTFIGLNYGGTYKVRCDVTNKAGTVQSRTATLTVGSALPNYTYSGGHQLIDDGGGNWRLKLTSSGTLRFTNRGTGVNGIDVFCVGGGAGGSGGGWNYKGGGGGGGGYTTTSNGVAVSVNTDYKITVGAGGSGGAWSWSQTNYATTGGASSAVFGSTTVSSNGGQIGGNKWDGGAGGSGGGGAGTSDWQPAGAGGSNGGNGANGVNEHTIGGSGQGKNTYEFGAGSGTLYAGGGGGGSGYWGGNGGSSGGAAGGAGGGGHGATWGLGAGSPGTDNTGGGGGGGGMENGGNGANGGSGIVIIRNKR